jgi:tetratricopeptide (TPR) repeat protein
VFTPLFLSLLFVAAPLLAQEPARDPWAAFPTQQNLEDQEQQREALKRFKEATRLFKEEQLSAAAEEAAAAARLQPANPRPFALMAAAYNRLGRFADAEESARRSIELKDNNAESYQSLAYAQLHTRRYAEAVISATHALDRTQAAMEDEEAEGAIDDEAAQEKARALATKYSQSFAIRAFAYEQLKKPRLMYADLEMAAEFDPGQFNKYLVAAKAGKRIFTPRNVGRGVGRTRSKPSISGNHPVAIGAAIVLITLVLALGAYLFLGHSAEKRHESDRPRPGPAKGDEKLIAGKYEMTRVIGKGGMGHVWEAKDRTLDRLVAVKIMTAEMGALGSQARTYYVKEARTVASLHHPHIIGIYEILDLKSGIYLVFEMASGKTVQHLLAEKKRLPLKRVCEILRPVCDALDFAHGRGFVHRDLKPANLMVTDQGFVKVMDFGIARRIHEDSPEAVNGTPLPEIKGIVVEKTTTVVGTPAYMAPEAGRGIVTSVSDVFPLGVCFYEMLTGKQPFKAREPEAKLERRYIKASEHVPGLPPEVDALVYDAMDPNPETRIPSAREFLSRLEHLPKSAL